MWLNFFCKTCKGNRNGILQNWILKPRFDKCNVFQETTREDYAECSS